MWSLCVCKPKCSVVGNISVFMILVMMIVIIMRMVSTFLHCIVLAN